jgi:hypothetical protein
MKMALGDVKPTFVLPGIKAEDVIRKYSKGYYQDLRLTKIKNPNSRCRSSPPLKCGVNLDEDVFTVRSKSGIRQVIVSTNCDSGEITRCEWCRLLFDGEIVNLEVFYQPPGYGGKSAMWLDGNFCDDRCSYAFADSKDKNSSAINYRVSITNLKLKYSLKYPDRPVLKKAPNYRLLKENGGPLSREQFRDSDYEYQYAGMRTKALAKPVREEETKGKKKSKSKDKAGSGNDSVMVQELYSRIANQYFGASDKKG